MGRVVLLWLGLAVWPAPALAVNVAHLDQAAWPGAAVTYAALARAVFAGIDGPGQAETWVTTREQVLRQPGTRQRTTLPAGSRLTGVEAFAVRGQGKAFGVTLWSFTGEADTPGGGMAVLALFPEGAAAPCDVVAVQTDAFCDALQGKTLPLGPGEAFFIRNHHSNSNQSYLSTGLYHVVSGRLRRIAEVFTLAVRADCRQCFTETLDWRTAPRPGTAYPDVTARVRLAPCSGCGGRKAAVRARTFAATSRFDAATGRYVASGSGLAALDAFNEGNL
ncbi:MAG: hypothetical protein ACP59X_02070 [Solidesulfovibrio sp. DCME]|uniref:hypothetical protein n=1 Tax=Solidesulfovibrio sp. DCME TaxID=3447380 RepID=UPI003D12B8F4